MFFETLPSDSQHAHASYEEALVVLATFRWENTKERSKLLLFKRVLRYYILNNNILNVKYFIRPNDYIDPITFKNGPLSVKERKILLANINLTEKENQKPKKQPNDIGGKKHRGKKGMLVFVLYSLFEF